MQKCRLRPGTDIRSAKTMNVSPPYQLGCWNRRTVCALQTFIGLFIATSWVQQRSIEGRLSFLLGTQLAASCSLALKCDGWSSGGLVDKSKKRLAGKMAGKLLMQIFLLIFVVRHATLWERALTFCCRIQVLTACIMCILYSLNQNYPSHQTLESFIASIILFKSRIHSMRVIWELDYCNSKVTWSMLH